MTKEEKILEKLKDEEYIKKISDIKTETIEFQLIKHGKPQPYARPRKGRGGFYNPLSTMMNEDRDMLKGQLSIDTRNKVEEFLQNSNDYYVYITLDFYLQIQKTSSIKDSVLKELNIIRPNLRPDLDNYDKYILDVLHDIAYDDDKNVIELSSNKYYSLNPRTEIKVKIIVVD